MDISSMTGFARLSGNFELKPATYTWCWEVKSVNGKSLELKAKLPAGLDVMNIALQEIAKKYFKRGNIYASLDLVVENATPNVKINNDLLQKIMEQAIHLYQQNPEMLQKPNPTEILNVRGVVEVEDSKTSEKDLDLLQNELLKGFEAVCSRLSQDRQAEGKKMLVVLQEILQNIGNLVANSEKIAETLPKTLKEKLQQQIAELWDGQEQISEERIAQEVVLYVNKADIREEIDRLKAHLKTAVELFVTGGAVGRRFDFLCQEFNRETNTMCSKSCDIELTNLGMELKAKIEQFREQIQNIE